MANDRSDDDLTRSRAGDPVPLHPAESHPDRIGDYRVLGVLGRGGMGVVYEAEQDSPSRVVALKVLRGDVAVDDLHVMLFRREVEVLARLEHPMIARLYASGRTPEGRHYFAMELVRGETLSEFLRRHEGPLGPAEIRRRLGLLAEIAEAVHYAHQRGVIHRDLKPSNLIVPPGEAGPARVKILDFGLARITDGDVLATQLSEVGAIRGTLSYMSPEQSRGRPEAVDLRTDVYSLGVILYVMLTGSLPHDLSSLTVVDALRVIEQARPRPLREAWKGTGRVDGDLETIVSKALEKDPNDRYGSAAALAEDLRRWLGSEPILARPPSTLYQIRKLVRRNPLPAAFAATLVVVLVAFAGTMAWQARRIAAERDRAQSEADKAAAINRFLQETLEAPNPYVEGGERKVTVLQALERSLGRIEKDFAAQPIVEAAVRETIAVSFHNVGEFEPVEPLLRRVIELRTENLGPSHPDTAKAWGRLSRFLHTVGRYDEAIEAAKTAVAAQRASGETSGAALAERLTELGWAVYFSGRPEEASPSAEEAVALARAASTIPTAVLGESLRLLADVRGAQGKLEEAEALATESVEAYRAAVGADNPLVDQSRNSLGILLMQRGEFERAERTYLEILENSRRRFGERHPQVALVLENLGNVHFRAGHPEQTIEILREVAALRREALGPNDPAVGRTLANLGSVLRRQGRLEEAEAALREGVKLMRAGIGEHPDVAHVLGTLGLVLGARGDARGAEAALRDSLRIRTAAFGEDHRLTASTRIDLGLQLLPRKPDEARALLKRGVDALAPVAGEEDPRVQAARKALG